MKEEKRPIGYIMNILFGYYLGKKRGSYYFNCLKPLLHISYSPIGLDSALIINTNITLRST